MKDIDKSKDQLIWDIKKLKQQRDLALYSKEQELKQLNKVLETVTSTIDLNDVVEKVMEALSDIFTFDQLSIYLFNSDKNTLEVNHWYGAQINNRLIAKFEAFPLSIEWDEVYFIKAFLDNETLYISPITDKLLKHYSDRDKKMFEWNPHKSIIIVPLQVQEKVIGVINFVNTADYFRLDEEDIAQIERYVAQIATTINNAYLVKKTNRALEQAKENQKEVAHLNQLIQATNASLEFDAVFKAILNGLKDLFDFEAIGIQLVDESNKLLNIYKVYGDMIEEHHIQQWREIQIPSEGGRSVSSYVFEKGETALFPYITADMPFAEIDLQIFQVMSFSAYFAIPLVVRSQKIGVISFFRTVKPFKLDEMKIAKISRYVETLSNTIKNSKTYHELQISYNRIDSLLNSSLQLYHLKTINEIVEYTAEQLILAFPRISLGIILESHLKEEDITLFHNMSKDEQALFSAHIDDLLSINSEEEEKNFLKKMDRLTINNAEPKHIKNKWRGFPMHSTGNFVIGKLVLRGINLKTQNENTLKLFIHQITSTIENRLLAEKLKIS
ncbi:MAG: GAF domain-containing protein [Oleiphilus sp.]